MNRFNGARNTLATAFVMLVMALPAAKAENACPGDKEHGSCRAWCQCCTEKNQGDSCLPGRCGETLADCDQYTKAKATPAPVAKAKAAKNRKIASTKCACACDGQACLSLQGKYQCKDESWVTVDAYGSQHQCEAAMKTDCPKDDAQAGCN